jgi:hypothetical protein
MGHYEDTVHFIYEEVEKMGGRKLFEKQLEKMSTQHKHKYKNINERWDYALYRIKGGKSK